MPYTGQCLCGAVKLTMSDAPRVTRQCWCRQCRKMAGGGPAHNAMFRTDVLTVSGTLAQASYQADSGATFTQHFCPTCGTPVYGETTALPHLRMVRFGVIDEPHDLAPQVAIWTSEAPPWAALDPAIPHWPGQTDPAKG